MKTRPRIMDTASPVGTNQSSQHERSTVIYQERRVGRREKALFTCGAEYDLYRRGHAERKHEIVQQRARRKGGDLEQPLRDGHLTRFEPREPGARRGRGRVPGYERWQLLGRDEEHLRERECRPCNKSVSQSTPTQVRDPGVFEKCSPTLGSARSSSS